jgi:hypothetical protein
MAERGGTRGGFGTRGGMYKDVLKKIIDYFFFEILGRGGEGGRGRGEGGRGGFRGEGGEGRGRGRGEGMFKKKLIFKFLC